MVFQKTAEAEMPSHGGGTLSTLTAVGAGDDCFALRHGENQHSRRRLLRRSTRKAPGRSWPEGDASRRDGAAARADVAGQVLRFVQIMFGFTGHVYANLCVVFGALVLFGR